MIGVEMQPKYEVVQLPFPQAAVEAVRTSAQNVKWIFRAIEGVVDEILRETSRIDVVVNNAGLMSIGLAEATPKRKRRMSWM